MDSAGYVGILLLTDTMIRSSHSPNNATSPDEGYGVTIS